MTAGFARVEFGAELLREGSVGHPGAVFGIRDLGEDLPECHPVGRPVACLLAGLLLLGGGSPDPFWTAVSSTDAPQTSHQPTAPLTGENRKKHVYWASGARCAPSEG